MSNLKTLLTVGHAAKGIPYIAADYADGNRNFGFTGLKGHPERIGQIEEAKGIPSYTALLTALNATKSPFFSVGCEKTFNSDESGHWGSGFMEFAFNFAELVSDASNYFTLFYHFTHDAAPFIKAHGVQFHWIITPARFHDGPCDGFTCSVWMTTAQFATAAEARAEWDAGVDCFCAFIAETEPYGGAPLYN